MAANGGFFAFLHFLAGPRGVFSWNEYLAETGSVAARWHFFKQVVALTQLINLANSTFDSEISCFSDTDG